MNDDALIIVNWKMNLDKKSITKIIDEILKINYSSLVLLPPSPYIDFTLHCVTNSQISVGVQNVCHYDNGSYTGEMSAKMAKDIGSLYVLAGHSERRILFNETDQIINNKIKYIVKSDLIPILCVGENLDEKNAGLTEQIITRQLTDGLLDIANLDKIIIAYEPVWAIGSKKPADIYDVNRVADVINSFMTKEIAKKHYVVYGGSVNFNNVVKFLSLLNIDGVLVGSSSLDGVELSKIIEVAKTI